MEVTKSVKQESRHFSDERFKIGKDSTKLIFTLPKTLYSQLKQEAEEQNRSMANLIVVILTDYFKKKGDSSAT